MGAVFNLKSFSTANIVGIEPINRDFMSQFPPTFRQAFALFSFSEHFFLKLVINWLGSNYELDRKLEPNVDATVAQILLFSPDTHVILDSGHECWSATAIST